MKKFVILVAMLSFGMAAMSQDSAHKDMQNKEHKMKNCVMMKDGKMMVMKDGKTTDMTEEMTLTNGTKVMTDGTVTMQDGTTKKLENGDCIFMNGKIKKWKGDKEPKKSGTK